MAIGSPGGSPSQNREKPFSRKCHGHDRIQEEPAPPGERVPKKGAPAIERARTTSAIVIEQEPYGLRRPCSPPGPALVGPWSAARDFAAASRINVSESSPSARSLGTAGAVSAPN